MLRYLFLRVSSQSRIAVRVLAIGLAVSAASAQADELVTFSGHVRRIFKKHCTGCHNANRSRAGLDLSSYASVMRGSDSGEVLVGGDPADSYLYLVTAHEEEPAMPPGGKKIPDYQLDLLKRWIQGGLLENDSSEPVGIRSANQMSDSASEQPTEVVEQESPANPPTGSEVLSLRPVYQGLQGSANRALAASMEMDLIAVSAQLQVLLYDANSYQLKGVLPFPEGEPQVLQFSPDGHRLLAGGGTHAQSGRVVLWDTQTGQRLWEGGDEFDVVMGAAISPNGKHVVLGGPERLIKVLSTESSEVVHRIEKHTDWVLAAAFSPDGLVFATADRDGGVYLWETESGELIHSFRGHKGAVNSIGFHPDQDTCFTASEDGTIRTWDLHTGAQVYITTAHSDGVLGAALGQTDSILSVGRDLRAQVNSSSETIATKSLSSLPINIIALGEGKALLSMHDGTQAVWNYSEDLLEQLRVPENLLTNNLSDVIPADFVSVRPSRPVESIASQPQAMDPVDSELLRLAASFEDRLHQASEKIPTMTQQVAQLRGRIHELEQSKSRLEQQLQSNLTELEETEGELKGLISELGQMFELTE